MEIINREPIVSNTDWVKCQDNKQFASIICGSYFSDNNITCQIITCGRLLQLWFITCGWKHHRHESPVVVWCLVWKHIIWYLSKNYIFYVRWFWYGYAPNFLGHHSVYGGPTRAPAGTLMVKRHDVINLISNLMWKKFSSILLPNCTSLCLYHRMPRPLSLAAKSQQYRPLSCCHTKHWPMEVITPACL